MYIDSFIITFKTKDTYKDTTTDVEKNIDTSTLKSIDLYQQEKIKKMTELMEKE